MATPEEPTTPAVEPEATPSEDPGGEEQELTLGAASGQVWVDQSEEAQPEGEADSQAGEEGKSAEPTGTADEGQGSDGESPSPEGTVEVAQQETGEEPSEPAPSGAASTDAEESSGETQPQPDTEPFAFTVDGSKVDVPGAIVGKAKGDDGEDREYILIPKQSWERVVQPRVADRAQIQQREAHLQREVERVRRELNPDHHPDVQRARAFSKEFDKILESEDSLRDFLANFDARRSHLKDRVDNAVLVAERESREEASQAEASERQVEEWAQHIATDLPQVVDSVLTDDRVKARLAHAPQAAAVFRQRVLRDAGRFYTIGTEETEKAGGLRRGQIGRDDPAIVRELQDVLALVPEGSAQPAQKNGKTTTADEAAKKNTQALGGGKKPPTTPSPKATASPSSQAGDIPEFKTKEELMAWAHR